MLPLLLLLVACPHKDDTDTADTSETGHTGESDTTGDSDTDTSGDSETDTGEDTDTGEHTDTDTAQSLPLGADCDPADDQCEPGALCCTECCEMGNTPVCTTADEDGQCPLPDVLANGDALRGSVYEEWEFFEDDDCAVLEGCVPAAGWRRLLRFDTTTPNLGTADLKFGSPDGNPLFHFSECHGHFHMDNYALFELVDSKGTSVAVGRKQAFCLMDYERVSADASTVAVYSCGYQGISVGWADTYEAYLDCQYIDITDVPDGDYTLRNAINPDHVIPEKDYTNNEASLDVSVRSYQDPLQDCTAGETAENRDCGWIDGGEMGCVAGEPTEIACADSCDGDCVPDPVMRVCAGADNFCQAYEALAADDDSCEYCPVASFTCPAEGVVTVLVGSYDPADGPPVCVPESI